MTNLLLTASDKKVLQVGEVAFKGHNVSRSSLYQNGITVSIEGENTTPQVEEKKVVPWLQNQLHSPNPNMVIFFEDVTFSVAYFY